MYKNFEKLLKERGVTAYRVAKETGVTTATLTSWKQGKYTPKPEKLQKIADYFGVSVDYLMTGNETNETLYTCPDCGLSYVPTDLEDAKHHIEEHEAWKAAENKFGHLYCNRSENEKIKHQNQHIRDNKEMPKEVRYDAVIQILKCYFSDSVSSSGFSLSHVPFKEYIAMLMNGERNRKIIAKDLADDVINEYGTLPGIEDGKHYYQIPSSINQEPITIAAHFDGTEYTEEELDEIRQFAEFVKNRRKS